MKIKHGDFSKLAENYSKFRPSYSKEVLMSILGILNKTAINFADVGAGTGIWTRMISDTGIAKIVNAVEPDDKMRSFGENHPLNNNILWSKGTGECTGLKENQYDLVTMASSFHWVDFDKAMTEFHRILKPGGIFVALWNPRCIDDNPILVNIENKILELNPNIKRISSGKSKFVENLTKNLLSLDNFKNLTFIEGRHQSEQNKKEYIGAWESVNDVQHQLGEKFIDFMDYINHKIKSDQVIKTTYLTRAWLIRKI